MRHFLLELMDDPQCMNPECRQRLSYPTLVNLLPRSFVTKELKSHREFVLLDRQKALLPSTQDSVTTERERRAHQKRMEVLEDQRERLKRALRQVSQRISEERNGYWHRRLQTNQPRRAFNMRCADDHCRGYLSEQYKCSVCERHTCTRCHALLPARPPRQAHIDVDAEDGQVANPTAQQAQQQHVCRPEDVATVELLRRDSKRCPSCASWIFRTEGCMQMFCTHCCTLFDYRSLRVLDAKREHVHNPYYTHWLASQRESGQPAREAGDIVCGGMPHAAELHRALRSRVPTMQEYDRARVAQLEQRPRTNDTTLRTYGSGLTFHRGYRDPDEQIQRILQAHRAVVHIENVTLLAYQPRQDEENLTAMRVQFCLGDFDEEAWKSKLQREEKARVKKCEVRLVLEMITYVCSDLFRQMVLAATTSATTPSVGTSSTSSTNKSSGTGGSDGSGASSSSCRLSERGVHDIFAEIVSVLTQANDALRKIALVFTCTVPHVNLDTFEVTMRNIKRTRDGTSNN